MEEEEPWAALFLGLLSAVCMCMMMCGVAFMVLLREHNARTLIEEERAAKLGEMKALGAPMGAKLGAVKRVFSGLLESANQKSPEFNGLPGRRRDEATAERLLGSV